MIKLTIEVDNEKHVYELNGDADITYTAIKHIEYAVDTSVIKKGLLSRHKLTAKEFRSNVKYLSKYLIKASKKPTEMVFNEIDDQASSEEKN